GLQILLEEMLPNGRHELEDYKSQMNLINNEITDTLAFLQHYQEYMTTTNQKKNKIKDVIKERNSQKKDSQKIKAEKNSTKKGTDIRTKKEEHGNPEKTIRNRRNQRKEKTHPSLLEPKKKDSKNYHFAQKTHQGNTKRNINHLTKKNKRIKKCGVIIVKQIHISPIAVINTEKT
ncbi:21195_t:CDS:2, partial [Gigaspora rosea]